MGIVIPPSMKASLGLWLFPPLDQMLTLLGNSIILIPSGVCDTFLWTVLSRQGFSLNAEIYLFRICRRENDEPRRLSEELERFEIKTYVNWSRNWSSKFLKIFENFLKVWRTIWWLVSLEVWMLWKFWTAMKKRENDIHEPLMRVWKQGGFYPTQILKRNPDRWIKTPPLDARSITPPKILNDVSRVLKRQKQ